MPPVPRGYPRISPVPHFKDLRYPVTETLTGIFGGYESEKSTRLFQRDESQDRVPGRRVEVVSEQLCGNTRSPQMLCPSPSLISRYADDILGYLAPSLEAYKGCTIIDVHPGACLWSSKLHDFLKPKRHILMEPEMRYHAPFVKPLLEQPGSTYRHTRLIGAHAHEYWDNYRRLLDDENLIGDRPALEHDDPKLRKIDTSLLVTGNLWRKYPTRYTAKDVDSSPLLLQHMTYAALTNSIFQRSGLVRMLWWAPDWTKHHLFPASVRGKRSLDLGLQMGASITEVAGVVRQETNAREARSESPRPPNFDASVLDRVERRMAQTGMKVPAGRELQPIITSTPNEKDIFMRDGLLKTTCTSIDELYPAMKLHEEWLKWVDGEFIARGSLRAPGGRGKFQLTTSQIEEIFSKTIRYPQCIEAIKSRPKELNFHRTSGAFVRSVMSMDVLARLINLEANYAAIRDTNPDPDALAQLHKDLLDLSNKTYKLYDRHTSMHKNKAITCLIDDIFSCEAQPETLLRDRRAYEPLQAHTHEFWPRFKVTLLDVMPNEADLSTPGVVDRAEGAKVCQELLKHLYQAPALSVPNSLNKLAPNAAQDLIPQVPALSDARKGGRLDVNQLRVRRLTREMMDGLVRAFCEWPFRPSSMEMTLAQSEEIGGLANVDDDEHIS